MPVSKTLIIASAMVAFGTSASAVTTSPAQGDVTAGGQLAMTRISFQDPDPTGACLLTLPLDKKMCVDDVLKSYCFRRAMFTTGSFYEDMTCKDLKDMGYY
jgi:hypothetical protein